MYAFALSARELDTSLKRVENCSTKVGSSNSGSGSSPVNRWPYEAPDMARQSKPLIVLTAFCGE
jgi:hypothetical protein